MIFCVFSSKVFSAVYISYQYHKYHGQSGDSVLSAFLRLRYPKHEAFNHAADTEVADTAPQRKESEQVQRPHQPSL